jgi:flagellar motor switch protein FliM
MVHRALAPLLEPMALEHATEGYVTVARSDLDALVGVHGDPQAVLAGFGSRAAASGVMIAEPSLSSAVLSRIWRSDRNEGAPLTQVEGEILRQFLARIVESWAGAWAHEGVKLLPEFTMASALSLLRPQLADGRWHIARTVVRERGNETPIGVLLFCYPDALIPQLANEARSTMWRSRLTRGLTEAERQQLGTRLSGPLRDLSITAPVRIHQHMTLGMLNALERGDVVAFDEDHVGDVRFTVLGREVTGRLAAHGDQLALALSGPAAAQEQPLGAQEHEVPPADTADFTNVYGEAPPEPAEPWELTG